MKPEFSLTPHDLTAAQTQQADIHRFRIDGSQEDEHWSSESTSDCLAVEEPMEIRLVYGDPPQSTSLSITMRTPGSDFDLAMGFLVTEGIVTNRDQIQEIQYCGPAIGDGPETNITKVTLSPETPFSLQSVQRHFYTTSSCGICGKASLDAVETAGLQQVPETLHWSAQQVAKLPARLTEAQRTFAQTGGLHASGLFDRQGQLTCLREDVGRHNALDKVIGNALQQKQLPLHGHGLVVSGRASFELVQKALMAGLEIMIAVGAPSSLAVALAHRFGLTLIGFASARRFNIYSHPQRIRPDA